MRSIVFSDPLYSGGSKFILVVIALSVVANYLYQECSDVLDNWDNDIYWSSSWGGLWPQTCQLILFRHSKLSVYLFILPWSTMDRVQMDNEFFSTLFFPGFRAPKGGSHPLHRKFWTRLNDSSLVGILLKVMLVYMLYRVVKRVALCLAPGLFYGTCWLDVIRNMFQCRSQRRCPQTRCPMRECPFWGGEEWRDASHTGEAKPEIIIKESLWNYEFACVVHSWVGRFTLRL